MASTWLPVVLIIALLGNIAWTGSPPDEEQVSKQSESSDKGKNPFARGWGDAINWVELEQGIDLAKEQKKPLMLIIHKTWCGACQSLKPKFGKAKIIAELAKNFIMVNAEDDEEPWEEEYYPDGGKYIPRILFLSPDGEVLKDMVNPKNEFKQYPYYYSNPAPIIHVMQSVLQRFGLAGAGQEGAKMGKGKKENSDGKDADESKEAPAKSKEDKEKPDEDAQDESKNADGGKKEKADLPRKEKAKQKSQSGESPESDSPKPPSQKPDKKEL